MNPESYTKNFRGFIMQEEKNNKKHNDVDRLRNMHLIYEGISIYVDKQDPKCNR